MSYHVRRHARPRRSPLGCLIWLVPLALMVGGVILALKGAHHR